MMNAAGFSQQPKVRRAVSAIRAKRIPEIAAVLADNIDDWVRRTEINTGIEVSNLPRHASCTPFGRDAMARRTLSVCNCLSLRRTICGF